MLQYRLSRLGLAGPGMPVNLTFSVTNLCQSRCRTCSIWQLYRKNPEKFKGELKTHEIETIFRKMGHVYVFNVSGGEPFLKKDFVQIIRLAADHLTPGIIHIPTNAIAGKKIVDGVRQILEHLKKHHPDTQLTIKPSLDHVGEKHDEIRGVPGNFEKVMALFEELKSMKSLYPNLHAELGTVISVWNVDDIEEIAAFATGLGTDSYRNEIAEQRSEMFNQEYPITPDFSQYENAISFFVKNIRKNMEHKSQLQRITNAFRLVYYELAIRIVKENRQVIPCYAGISNVHMTPYGDIWACCTLGYDKPMGNLKDFDYDFKKLWKSPEADRVRQSIRKGECACPLANQTYSNILLHWPSLFRVIREIFLPKPPG